MSSNDVIWSIKNGDMDQVREHFETTVSDAFVGRFENKFLLQKSNINEPIEGRPPIHYAADYGQKDIIKYLISKGADLNVSSLRVLESSFMPVSCQAMDKHGIRAVLPAIWEGHTECVKLMLESGADKNGKTPDGKSYLEVAEKEEIINLLK